MADKKRVIGGRLKTPLTPEEAREASARAKFTPGFSAGDIINVQSSQSSIADAARDRLARNLLGFNLVDPETGEETLVRAGRPRRIPRS